MAGVGDSGVAVGPVGTSGVVSVTSTVSEGQVVQKVASNPFIDIRLLSLKCCQYVVFSPV